MSNEVGTLSRDRRSNAVNLDGMAFSDPSANEAIDNIIDHEADANEEARIELPINALCYQLTLRAERDMHIFDHFQLRAGEATCVNISDSQLKAIPWAVTGTERSGTVDLMAWISEIENTSKGCSDHKLMSAQARLRLPDWSFRLHKIEKVAAQCYDGFNCFELQFEMQGIVGKDGKKKRIMTELLVN